MLRRDRAAGHFDVASWCSARCTAPGLRSAAVPRRRPGFCCGPRAASATGPGSRANSYHGVADQLGHRFGARAAEKACKSGDLDDRRACASRRPLARGSRRRSAWLIMSSCGLCSTLLHQSVGSNIPCRCSPACPSSPTSTWPDLAIQALHRSNVGPAGGTPLEHPTIRVMTSTGNGAGELLHARRNCSGRRWLR